MFLALCAERFTVLSYNILADYLAINHRSKLYFHVPRHVLDWEFRKRSIMFELGLWSADILCFQVGTLFRDLLFLVIFKFFSRHNMLSVYCNSRNYPLDFS